jgi:hypothetical protein
MYEVKSTLNPAIFKSPATNKTYIVAGDQPWIEVPPGTTLDEVRWIPSYEPQKAPVDARELVFTVEGSRGNKYTVKCHENDTWSCTCVGFGFRGICKHVTKYRESHKD